jgi:hypothetical protein
MTADVFDTIAGENVVLHVADLNDGTVPLTDPHIHLFINGVEVVGSPFMGTANYTFPAGTGYSAGNVTFVGGDGPVLGVMDVGETWHWDISVTIYSTANFTVWGGGSDPLGFLVMGPEYPTEVGNTTVRVLGLTRTQGFWATHLEYTTQIFNSMGSFIDLGWKQITNISDLMGIFWANNAKESDGTKRDALCKARETTSNQALAAILNTGVANGADLTAWLNSHGYTTTNGSATIASILGGSNITAIMNLNGVLDAYNNSGDGVAFPDGTVTGRATPQAAKATANISFADCD